MRTRIGIVQMTSGKNLTENLEKMQQSLDEAVKAKAQIVAFPEMAYLSGSLEDWRAVLPRYEECLDKFAGWARDKGVFLLPGSLREPVRGTPDRYFNTSVLFDPTGRLVAKYRKIFLFQAQLPDKSYDEGKHCESGNMVVTSETSLGQLGFAICFDLRFPELFRGLKKRGADIVFVPASFTATTGQAHWHTLLKARAIENQCFVVAPAQTGRVGEGGATYGHALCVSPWGEVLADLGESEGVQVVELDLGALQEARTKVDAWACRREDLFRTS